MGKLQKLLKDVELKSQKLEQATTQLQKVNTKLKKAQTGVEFQEITAEYKQLTRVMQLLERHLLILEHELKEAVIEAEATIEVEHQAHGAFVNLLAETAMTHLSEHQELEKVDVLVNLLAEAELEQIGE
ncbi:MAG: hypothetical protein ACRC5Q_01135 [Culicoidibacterales bacterium]